MRYLISMNMLFPQKLANKSGKKPHYCAIENACIVKHFWSINFKTMKKFSIAVILVQFLATTAIMVTEAKTLSFNREKENKQTEEKDLETEVNHEKDAFPDITRFATSLFQ